MNDMVCEKLTDVVPEIRTVRHELRKRNLEVVSVDRITPHMIRVTLTGEDMIDFVSDSPDDHLKIIIPGVDGVLTRRDYTPRFYDQKKRLLVLDFVNHDGGPAASWARAAKVGDRLEIGGPRGSRVIGGDIAQWLLIGDETALPAIGRRVEELPAGMVVTSVVAVNGPEDEQIFTTQATHLSNWVHREISGSRQETDAIISVLKGLTIEPRTFVWVGAEASVARAVRQYLQDERKISPSWIKASGYWVRGQADTAVKDLG